MKNQSLLVGVLLLLFLNQSIHTQSRSVERSDSKSETGKQNSQTQAAVNAPVRSNGETEELTGVEQGVENSSEGSAGSADSAVEASQDGGEEVVSAEQDEFRLDFIEAEGEQAINISTLSFFDVLRIVFILGLIIGATYVIIWLLKKIQSKSLLNSQSIELLSTQSLHQGNMLYVVKVGETYLLIGSSGQSVAVLKEFMKKEERDELLLSLSVGETQEAKSKKRSFVTVLRSLLRVGTPRTASKGGAGSDVREQRKESAMGKTLNVLSSRVKKSEELNGKH